MAILYVIMHKAIKTLLNDMNYEILLNHVLFI